MAADQPRSVELAEVNSKSNNIDASNKELDLTYSMGDNNKINNKINDKINDTNKMLIRNDASNNDKTNIALHALSDESSITLSISVLFILFGVGPSWLLADAMFIEIPYWQRYQPEGLSLANKMTISGIMPLVTVIPIYFIIINNIGSDKLSFRKLIYFLIGLDIISCIFISFGWTLTIDNISIIIHLVTFLSSFIGHMMLFAIVPWVTSINHKLSAPILTGTNLGTLCSAITGLIQQPGSDNPLFTPSIYYLLWIFVFLGSLISFIYLDYKYLKDIEIILQKHHRTKNEINILKRREKYNNSKCRLFTMILSTFNIPIWWKEIWKFAVLNSYIQLITWVFIRSTIPFAVRNASSDEEGDNTETEQYAIELSYVAVLFGSLLSIFIGIKQNKYFLYLISIYTLFAFIFLFISLDDNGLWVFWGSGGFVVFLVFVMRFLDGYISPLIYQNIARKYPNKSHEMNQWISATAAIAAFIGVWITYLLVQYHI